MTHHKKKKKRRGRGEGSIYKRGDGRWVAILASGEVDITTGRKKRKYIYAESKTEVLHLLEDHKAKLKAKRVESHDKRLLCDYLDSWLETKKLSVEKRTQESYESHVRVHIKPNLGSIKLQDLTSQNVQDFYSKLVKDGVSSTQARKVGTTLGVALADAVRARHLLVNPSVGIRKPKKVFKESEVWDEEQLRSFLAAAKQDERHWPFYLTMLDSGLRPGELWALRWSDVNLELGILTIRRAIEGGLGPVGVKAPKTSKGRRNVVLSPPTVAVLRELREKRLLAGAKETDLIFCNIRGGFMRFSNFYRDSYNPLLERANLPHKPLYTLRHTSATLLLLLGEPAKIVSERLGHSTTRLTLDTYSHVLPSMQKTTADRLGGLLEGLMAKKDLKPSEADGVNTRVVDGGPGGCNSADGQT